MLHSEIGTLAQDPLRAKPDERGPGEEEELPRKMTQGEGVTQSDDDRSDTPYTQMFLHILSAPPRGWQGPCSSCSMGLSFSIFPFPPFLHHNDSYETPATTKPP
jgi:hypothetical protein